MAFATTTTHTAGFSFTARVQKLVEDFKAAQVLRRKYRQTLTELRSLDDRELRDLGLSRYDLDAIAYQHVYGA